MKVKLMTLNIINRFKLLPLYIKSMFVGLVMSCMGLFFNWFKSVDTFSNAVSFNGLSGPIKLAGYTILGISGYSILVLLKYLKENECEFNQLKKYYVEKWAGITVLYLSVLVASVYLSGDIFNNLDKKIGVGFFITFSGSLITIIGTILFKTKNCSRNINKNQLNLGLEISDALDFSLHAKNTLDNVVAKNDPIFKEQLRKQREIEAKITNK
jgi:hypothetical protein